MWRLTSGCGLASSLASRGHGPMSVQDQILDGGLDSGQRWALVKELRKAGDIERALVMLKPLYAQHPSDFRYALCLGELLLQEGAWDEAIDPLSRARRLGPPDPKTSDLLDRLEIRCELMTLERDEKPSELIARYHQLVRERPDATRRV